MRAEEQFDSFYLKSRRALVHQTFALTGDLGAAQKAVRDAYVAGWHHWRKVSRQEDPREWVRPRAWILAQRRHTARLWHRTKSISGEDREVLDALHKLPVAERRAYLLLELAGVPLEVAGREANTPQQTVDLHSRLATTRLVAALGGDGDSVRARVKGLVEASSRAALPRPAAIRREGRRRRRTHTLVAAATATFVAVGSGAFAHQPDRPAPEAGQAPEPVPEQSTTPRPAAPEEPSGPALPSAADLLTVADVARIAPGSRWREGATHDNTSGEGLNTICQQERFADPDGLAALVRTLTARGRTARTLVQTMEVSEADAQAEASFDTIVSWFSGCPGDRVHLERTHRVEGLGDRAMMFELRSWRAPRPRHTVTVSQLGQVVTSTVLTTSRGEPPPPARMARVVARSGERICTSTGMAACVDDLRVRVVAPAPAGEEPGILATVDLPGLPDILRPWAATAPAPARPNPAATTCDRAAFGRAGAERTRTRTFLVPEARLPDRFGLTETYGSFARPRAAAAFLATVRERVSGCEDRDLATEVVSSETLGRADLEGTLWRLRTELSEEQDVVFDVGFVRRGRHVAQLTFVPAGRASLREGDFRALLVRAGERLAELD